MQSRCESHGANCTRMKCTRGYRRDESARSTVQCHNHKTHMEHAPVAMSLLRQSSSHLSASIRRARGRYKRTFQAVDDRLAIVRYREHAPVALGLELDAPRSEPRRGVRGAEERVERPDELLAPSRIPLRDQRHRLRAVCDRTVTPCVAYLYIQVHVCCLQTIAVELRVEMCDRACARPSRGVYS